MLVKGAPGRRDSNFKSEHMPHIIFMSTSSGIAIITWASVDTGFFSPYGISRLEGVKLFLDTYTLKCMTVVNMCLDPFHYSVHIGKNMTFWFTLQYLEFIYINTAQIIM